MRFTKEMMKFLAISAVASAGIISTGVAQADEKAGAFTTSGDVAFTSNYLYRGFTQSSDSPAIQGSLKISHESGAYVNLWGSSITFASGLELDPSIGFAGSSGDVEYDVGVLYYGYPGSTADEKANASGKYDFPELYGSLSYKGATAGLAYAKDFFGETGESIYISAGYGVEVNGVGLSAHAGYNILDDAYYTENVLDYKVAISKELSGLGMELAFVGTDAKGNDESLVFTLSKSF